MNDSQSTRPAECLSDFALDAFIADEHTGGKSTERARLHLSECARCAARLNEFRSVELPVLTGLTSTPKRIPMRPKLSALSGVAALALAGIVGMVVLRARPSRTPEQDVVRTKGTIALQVLARRNSGRVERLAPSGVVNPNDSLRFEVALARPGFVAILGLDAAGTVSVYVPQSESAPRLIPGPPAALPETIVADATLGPERIVALLCQRAPTPSELREAGERALQVAAGDPKRVGDLNLECSQSVFDIEKRTEP